MYQYLKDVHANAKEGAAYERYMQDTVHNWREPPEDVMPGEDAASPPKWIAWAPLWVIVRYWRARFHMDTLVHLLRRFYLAHVVEILYYEALRVLICNRRGHDLEDTGSWGGPDSGGEDHTCRRCGSNFRHIMY